jgi:hypothetical protein
MPATELKKQQARGVTASCGCMRLQTISRKATQHAMSKHPAYAVWRSMLARCENPRHRAFKNYGARGIGVCASWRDSFAGFWADMGPTYREGMTLERRENELGYSPENCTWATPKAQANNTRTVHRLATPLGVMSALEAANRFGVKYSTLQYRLTHGWELRRALNLSST